MYTANTINILTFFPISVIYFEKIVQFFLLQYLKRWTLAWLLIYMYYGKLSGFFFLAAPPDLREFPGSESTKSSPLDCQEIPVKAISFKGDYQNEMEQLKSSYGLYHCYPMAGYFVSGTLGTRRVRYHLYSESKGRSYLF